MIRLSFLIVCLLFTTLHAEEGFPLRKKYPQVKTLRSLEELIEKDDLDLVVIATPSRLHFEQAKKCIIAGKNVVVEKKGLHKRVNM